MVSIGEPVIPHVLERIKRGDDEVPKGFVRSPQGPIEYVTGSSNEMLREVGWAETELRKHRKGDKKKVRMAVRLREETTMSWIAMRLAMGHWRTASNAARICLTR